MKDFFKTFGKGLLYFILFPFLLVYLVILGIYLFFKNIYYFFFIHSKKYKGDVDKTDNHAQKILDDNRYETVEEKSNDAEIVKEEHHEHNSTINNYIIADEATLKKIMNGKPVEKALEDNEAKKVDAIDLDIKTIEQNTYVEEIDADEDDIDTPVYLEDENTLGMDDEEKLKYHGSSLRREEEDK